MSTDRTASALCRQLTAYFRSGWAFFIPYLATYLIYYWQQWPANPPLHNAVSKELIEGGHRFSSFLPSLTPIPLLHVYWVLHAIHAILAAITLCAWWTHSRWKTPNDTLREHLSTERSEHPALGSLVSAANFTLHCPSATPFYSMGYSAAIAVAPWFLLALLFYIPGVYLEWPSDPWEHLRRIAEWGTHDIVGSHSAGHKMLYFFAYSLLGRNPTDNHFFSLDVYDTGMCLLLAWQYYLLAKAVGLGQRFAFLSVVVNVLTLGNVCFSFYRYYGLASTILAQIGAVALTRVAILIPAARGTIGEDSGVLICGAQADSDRRKQSLRKMRLALMLLPPCSLLLTLIAFNHVQGLGIAGLSIASIAAWRLIEWKRSMVLFLAAGAVALSVATIISWPRNPLIISEYRPNGWLNAWYGFNLIAWPSPAADRAMQVLGLFGVINLGAGLVLLRRNHLIGWLTVGPLIALGLPLVAIPFSEALARNGEPIVVFHRLLFAIPSGLSLTYLSASVAKAWNIRLKKRDDSGQPSPSFQVLSFGGGLIAVATLVLIPSTGRYFNRLWNTFAIPADDLELAPIVKISRDLQYIENCHVDRVLCAPSTGFVLLLKGAPNIYGANRSIVPTPVPSARADMILRSISAPANDKTSRLLVVPRTTGLNSSQSIAAFLSKQWLSNEVALEYTGGPEYEEAALAFGYREIYLSNVRMYLYKPPRRAN